MTETLGVHAAVFSKDPGAVYLLASDVLAVIRANVDNFERQIADFGANDGADTEMGRLKMASLVGASAALAALGDNTDLLCMELTTDAVDLIDEMEHRSG